MEADVSLDDVILCSVWVLIIYTLYYTKSSTNASVFIGGDLEVKVSVVGGNPLRAANHGLTWTYGLS